MSDPVPVDPVPVAPYLTRVLGFPPAAALFPLPLGAFACSLILDVAALVDTGPCTSYSYAAFLLLVIGVVGGIVTAHIALPDLARLRPNARVFRSGIRQLLLCDASLVCFGVSAYLRRDADTCADTAWGPFVLSVIGGVLLAVAVVTALRIVFGAVERRWGHQVDS